MKVFGHPSAVCPRSLDLFYIVTYCIKLTKTSWTDSSTLWLVMILIRTYVVKHVTIAYQQLEYICMVLLFHIPTCLFPTLNQILSERIVEKVVLAWSSLIYTYKKYILGESEISAYFLMQLTCPELYLSICLLTANLGQYTTAWLA